MSRLVQVSVSRQLPPVGLMARMRHALRAYWTKPFSLKDPALNQLFGYSSRTLAGPLVNEHTIFACAAVFDAVNQISSDVAKLPLNLKKRRQDGGADDYVGSKTYRLMKYRPNPETGSMVFRRTILMHALISKSGFAEIERDNVGRPVALWILEPHRVRPFYDVGQIGPDGRKDPLRYRVDNETVFEARDILHIQGPGWDGVVGFEMVQIAREAIGLALASQQFASAFFGNQSRFGGILMSEQDLDEDQEKELREKIEELHARADKAFRLLVLGAGFKYQSSGVNPNEAQMKEIRDQQVQEVARFFNMPLHKLKLAIPGAVSYASVEMADLDYYKGTLLNWITLCEEEYNAKLISPLEQGLQYFKHNANAFLRGDIKSRYDALGLARDKGIINADEWREWEDWNPQPDGQGQVYLVQQAMVPASALPDLIQSQIDKNKAAVKKLTEPPTPTAAPPANGNGDAGAGADRALREKLETAEKLLEEARKDEATARNALAALEAKHGVTEQELQHQRDVVAAAVGRMTQFEVIADFVRSKAEALQASHDNLAAAVAHETSAREAAERALEQAREAAEGAAAERDRALADAGIADTVARAAKDAESAAAATLAEANAALNDARSSLAEARETIGRLTQERDEKVAAVAAAEAALVEARAVEAATSTALQNALQKVEGAVGDRTEAEREAAEARAQAEAASAATVEAESAKAQALTVAEEASHRAEETIREASERAAAAEAAKFEALRALEAAGALTREAEAARAAACAEAETATQRAMEAATAAAERIAALEAAVQQAGAERQAESEARAAAEARATDVRVAHDMLAAARAALEDKLAAAEAAQRESAEAFAQRTAQERERLTSVIAAHRHLVADAMGRMCRLEAETARRKPTPEKLRRWLSGFPTLHEAVCLETLLPAIRVCLAWAGSNEDPLLRTRSIVQEHIQMFVRQLEGVLAGDAEEFHALLDNFLARWESDRADMVADALLAEEIRHVQTR